MPSIAHSVGTTIYPAILVQDPLRMSFSVFNKSATAIIYIKEGKEVSATNGIPVYPRGNFGLVKTEDGDPVGEEWCAISDTASTNVVVFEGRSK